ncbi:MAG: hypothetical protein WCO67_27515, partial [Betaproteobacteria bacterium]
MALTSTSVRASFAGNGAATSFAFTFQCYDATTLAVYLTDSAGSVTTASASAYSVSLLPDYTGGTVTYPLTGAPIASGVTLTVVRTIPLTQPVAFTNQSGWYPTTMNIALDNAAMRDQQLA